MDDTVGKERDPIGSTKLIVGLFFAIAGVLMTAANLGWWEGERLLRYWPAVLLIIGIVKLASGRQRLAGALFLFFGAVLLARTAGWVHYDLFDLWPLFLIVAGLAMVARAFGFRPRVIPESSGDNVVAVFAPVKKVVNPTRDFRGSRVVVCLGGAEIDLTRADITSGPAVIDCFVFMGSIEIRTPETWDVVGEVVPVMAGFEVRTGAAADPKKQLIVRGTALIGAIEVKRGTP